MKIIRARSKDASTLTGIAFAAKRSWGYPESWIEDWADVLTVTPGFMRRNPTYVATMDGRAAGFYSLARRKHRVMLEHLWVWPAAMGLGIGRCLFEHAVASVRSMKVACLEIESDPNAEVFYLRMGARRSGLRCGFVEGVKRELPVLEFVIGESGGR